MPIPNVTESFLDGGLGLIPAETGRTMLTIGVSSAGTPNVIVQPSTPDQLVSSLGRGPLVEAGAAKLAETGHGDLLFMPVTSGTAGSIGTVTPPSGTPPTLTPSGTPNDSYDVKVKITTGGTLGTALFQFSTDGGDTYSPDITTVASYVVPNTGLTLGFAAGTYVVNDVYSFATVSPYYTTGNLTTAINAALAAYNTTPFGLIHVVGVPGGIDDAAKSTALASVFATVDALMAAAEAQHKFIRVFIEAPDVADAALMTAFASLASVHGRTFVVAGFTEYVSQTGSGIQKRHAAWPALARISAIPISQDAAWVGAGPLNGIRSIYRDEAVTGGLDAARFITLRTVQGRSGFYVTNPVSMANITSDYHFLQHGRIADRLAEVTRNGMLYYLNGRTRVDKTTGRILEQDAAAIDADVGGQVRTALFDPGHVSDTIVRMNRTDNVLSTGILRVSSKAVPLNYPKAISIELGFINPALLQTAPAA